MYKAMALTGVAVSFAFFLLSLKETEECLIFILSCEFSFKWFLPRLLLQDNYDSPRLSRRAPSSGNGTRGSGLNGLRNIGNTVSREDTFFLNVVLLYLHFCFKKINIPDLF